VVQQHWMGPKAGFSGSVKSPVMQQCAHCYPSKAAPNKAQHGPRQTMNCQLHIVTSFVGPTERTWSDAGALHCAHFHPRLLQTRHSMAQLHIVTSFDGPTQRKCRGATALDGAQELVVQAFARIQIMGQVCSFSPKAAPNKTQHGPRQTMNCRCTL
jgi:hypothetical protein